MSNDENNEPLEKAITAFSNARCDLIGYAMIFSEKIRKLIESPDFLLRTLQQPDLDPEIGEAINAAFRVENGEIQQVSPLKIDLMKLILGPGVDIFAREVVRLSTDLCEKARAFARACDELDLVDGPGSVDEMEGIAKSGVPRERP
jgi:hypothetical protein